MASSRPSEGHRKGSVRIYLSPAEIQGRLRELEKSITNSPIGHGIIIEPYPTELLKLDYRCPRCKAITHFLPFADGQGVLIDPKGFPEFQADRQPPIALNDLPVYRQAVFAARGFGIPLRFVERPLCARCRGHATTPSSPYYEFFFDESRPVPVPEDALGPFDLAGLVSLLRGGYYTGPLCDARELRSRIDHFIDLVEASR